MVTAMWLAQRIRLLTQHEYHASQVPPEWHSWLSHIRRDPPTEDPVMQNLSPAWKSVRCVFLSTLGYRSHRDPIRIALGGELDRHERSIQDLQYCGAKVDGLGTEGGTPPWCLSIDVGLVARNQSVLVIYRATISTLVFG